MSLELVGVEAEQASSDPLERCQGREGEEVGRQSDTAPGRRDADRCANGANDLESEQTGEKKDLPEVANALERRLILLGLRAEDLAGLAPEDRVLEDDGRDVADNGRTCRPRRRKLNAPGRRRELDETDEEDEGERRSGEDNREKEGEVAGISDSEGRSRSASRRREVSLRSSSARTVWQTHRSRKQGVKSIPSKTGLGHEGSMAGQAEDWRVEG